MIALGVTGVILLAAVIVVFYPGGIQQVSGGLSMLKEGANFAGGGGLPQVQTASVGLIADSFTGNKTVAPTCSATPEYSTIELLNTGKAEGTATGVTITYGGASNVFRIAGPCAIGPAGSPTSTMYITFIGPNELANSAANTAIPVAGQPFGGTVTLSNGAQLPFLSNFAQGGPQVSTTSLALPASDFTAGKPTNSTCGAAPPAASGYIMLTNAGTEGAAVSAVTITWKNATNTFAISGSCDIGPWSGVTYVLFGAGSTLSVAAEAGQPFTGTVTLSTGTPIQFGGNFQ